LVVVASIALLVMLSLVEIEILVFSFAAIFAQVVAGAGARIYAIHGRQARLPTLGR